MSGNELARVGRERGPALEVPRPVRPTARLVVRTRAHVIEAKVDGDAYGCVEWFDYCAVAGDEPPSRRIRS